jgi:hypothetical protein
VRSGGGSGALFPAVSEIFDEVCQSDQDDSQPGYINDIGIRVEHARQDHRKNRSQNRSDDKCMKSGHGVTSWFRLICMVLSDPAHMVNTCWQENGGRVKSEGIGVPTLLCRGEGGCLTQMSDFLRSRQI